MEYMSGGSLYDLIKEYEKIKLKEEHIAYVLKEVPMIILLRNQSHYNIMIINFVRPAVGWPTSTP